MKTQCYKFAKNHNIGLDISKDPIWGFYRVSADAPTGYSFEGNEPFLYMTNIEADELNEALIELLGEMQTLTKTEI